MDSVPIRILEISGSIGAAIAFLYVLGRLWQPSERSLHNDVIGPAVGVVGTTYAVLLAFMLSGVWSSFRLAEATEEQEANSLVSLFRLSQGLPSDTRERIRRLAHDYAEVMISIEWNTMKQGSGSVEGQNIVDDFWKILATVQPQRESEQVALDHAFSELSSMTEHRRIRLLQSRSQLPAILWAVLLAGAIVSVLSVCLFGVEDFKLHAVQVFVITFLISLVLVAIEDIDRPYQGSVHVDPGGFRFALQTFDRTP